MLRSATSTPCDGVTGLLVLSAALLGYGVLLNRLGWQDRRGYTPINLAVAATLVAGARARGLSWSELGIGGVLPGLIWGVGLGVVAGIGLLLAAGTPRLHRFLTDRRMAGLDRRELLYQVLFRIPFGTALAEEVLFRGVLLGLWMARSSVIEAVVGSSMVFGLWHVAPSLLVIRLNRPGIGRGRLAAGVAGAVVSTTLAGAGLCWLRFLTGGVVGPVVVHASVNSLAAFASHRLQRESG